MSIFNSICYSAARILPFPHYIGSKISGMHPSGIPHRVNLGPQSEITIIRVPSIRLISILRNEMNVGMGWVHQMRFLSHYYGHIATQPHSRNSHIDTQLHTHRATQPHSYIATKGGGLRPLSLRVGGLRPPLLVEPFMTM